MHLTFLQSKIYPCFNRHACHIITDTAMSIIFVSSMVDTKTLLANTILQVLSMTLNLFGIFLIENSVIQTFW